MEHTETRADRMLFHPVAVGVMPDGTVARPWCPTWSMGPAGSTCASTAADLVRFAGLLLSDGRNAEGTPVLSTESVAAMTSPVVEVATGFPAEQWCLGAGWSGSGSHPVLGHPGFNHSGCSVLWWVPDLGAAIACVTNAPASFGALMECADQVLRALGGSPPAHPKADRDQVVDPTALAGVYDSGMLRYEVTVDGGDLVLHAEGRGLLEGQIDATTRLVPAGRHGFLPEQPLLPGIDAPTAIAFRDYAGTRVLLNGNAAASAIPDVLRST